ncbi:MAG: cytochrome c biogenesis protein CcsA [Proteobacteria bacterium]|nr:cytochrome c biogenesis protein CcsA [Pseudomonadota bacterium]
MLLAYFVDALFGVLAIILIRNIFAKQNFKLIAPFCISAFAVSALLFFYLTSAITIANVWLNSHQSTPIFYKISGVWGNHEGSMLLFFTFLSAWATRLRHTESIRLASFILLVLGSYLYFAANPFAVLAIKMTAGQDLNPALQNPYLAIHPPILYAGQTLCFLLWAKACITPDDPEIPFYTRVCFCLITLGLALGARWAYTELGWGGFWFWDPVETVSLFPWLAIAAAVHVYKNNSYLQRLCLLIAFPMVMLGLTFVRSGVLVSVHSFGFDAFNGIWLGVSALVVGVISVAFVIASPCNGRGNPVNSFHALISLGFLSTLAILCALILIPVFFKICLGKNISINEAFFHQYINPFLLAGLLFAGFAPYMKIHFWSFANASFCTILWYFLVQPHFHLLAICAALVGFWLILSTLNHSKYIFTKGFVAAHLGVGLCILGASHAEIFTTKQEININALPLTFAAYPVRYVSHHVVETPQVTKEIFTFSINAKLLQPEIQHFHISQATKHQTAVNRINFDDFHATVFANNNQWKIELMHKPLINVFWLGILMVLLGISVSMRRFLFNAKSSKD